MDLYVREYSIYEEDNSVYFSEDYDDLVEIDVDHATVKKVYEAALSGLAIDDKEINYRNDSGLTALMIAIKRKNLRAQKVLIQAGADLNISRSNRSFYTALSLAVDRGLSTTVKELLRRGPFLSCINGIKALEIARAKGLLCYVVEGENYQIAQNKQKEMNGRTGVYRAVKENRLDLVRDLIKAGSYITLMHKSTYTNSHNNKYVLQHLIEEGVNVNMVFKEDKTPLILAIYYKSLICVDILLQAKANVNFVRKNKLTPLHMAAEYVQEEIVKKLIEAGADVNAETSNGETPLHFAVRFVLSSASRCES
ncbi:ankyrin-3-like [Physella acuta]|uniref:ankyrin-3-like n=1 Tax=Physella acuta TaxID=109671 RepID=UPI0027DE5FEF|nr:ankyrin-3-like [Physella acuta]